MNKMMRTAAAMLLCVLLSGCGAESSLMTEEQLLDAENARIEAENEQIAAENEQAADRGYSFPDLQSFTANTLDGGQFTEADLAEKDVTVLNIWATTCPPCIEEMGELGRFEKNLPENVRLMTWCLDAEYSANKDDIPGFLDRMGYEGITLTSGDGDLMNVYGALMYTPTTLLYGSDGALLAEPLIGAGRVTERYTEAINAALAAKGLDPLPESAE